MLLTNGRVYTLDARGSVVDTLVVRDGRVAFAGRRFEVNPAVAEEIVDLGGRAVLPGLVDAHGHLMYLARTRLSLDARGLASEDEVARRIGERVAAWPRGEWIIGHNWDQNLWPDRAFPGKASLDRVAPDRPVVLVRVDGHATWANSAALGAAGIDRATPDPAGGILARDARASRPVSSSTRPGVCSTGWCHGRRTPSSTASCASASTTAWRSGSPGSTRWGPGCTRWPLSAAARARRLSAPQLRRGRRALGFDLGPLPAARSRDARRRPDRGRRGEAAGRRRARLARGRAAGAYCDDPGNTGLVLVPGEEVERVTLEAGRAARARAAAWRLRMALAARHRRADRRSSDFPVESPTPSTGSTPRSPAVRGPATIRAGSQSSG